MRKLNPVAGPQREIFPGGTKIDAGPPKFGEVQTNQKRSSLKFDPIFCPKLGEEQKKKVFTQIWSHFLLKKLNATTSILPGLPRPGPGCDAPPEPPLVGPAQWYQSCLHRCH